jgi:hypothetical protein
MKMSLETTVYILKYLISIFPQYLLLLVKLIRDIPK